MKHKYIGNSIAARFQNLPLNCRPTSLQNKRRLSSSRVKNFVPSLKVMRYLVPSTAKRQIDCISLGARTRRKLTQRQPPFDRQRRITRCLFVMGWTIVEHHFARKTTNCSELSLLCRLDVLITLQYSSAFLTLIVLILKCASTFSLSCITYWPSQLQLRSKLKEIIRFEYFFSSRFKNLN